MKEVLCHQNLLPFEPFHCLASISSVELILVEFSPSSKCLLDLLLGQDPNALALKDDALWFNTLSQHFSPFFFALHSPGVSWPAEVLRSSCHCSILLLRNPPWELPLLLFTVGARSSGSSPLFALWNVSGVSGECGLEWLVLAAKANPLLLISV